MARKTKNTDEVAAPKGKQHVVKYTEANGENIVAKFSSPAHAHVLRSRLKSHGVAHTYEGDEVAPVDAAT